MKIPIHNQRELNSNNVISHTILVNQTHIIDEFCWSFIDIPIYFSLKNDAQNNLLHQLYLNPLVV